MFEKARMGNDVMLKVLNKPGELTSEEFTVIKSHPVEGHKLLLDGADVDAIVLDSCLHHHEKTDGSSCPDGLKGGGISLFIKTSNPAAGHCFIPSGK